MKLWFYYLLMVQTRKIPSLGGDDLSGVQKVRSVGGWILDALVFLRNGVFCWVNGLKTDFHRLMVAVGFGAFLIVFV
jgi:hypothetical protein